MQNKLFVVIGCLISNIVIADTVIPPASIRTEDVNSICNTKTSTIRNVSTKTKKLVYLRAGVPYGDREMCWKGYEVDHIASLNNGGSNDISNLQLQAYCTYGELLATDGKRIADSDGKIRPGVVPKYKGLYDARAKDVLENKIHKDICIGKITPHQGQMILRNWKN